MMKIKLTHSLCKWNAWIFLLLLTITGCQNHSPIANKLQQAETIMNEHPDSALSILKSIAGSDLRTKEQHARHALLYSQALDKNYIDLTNDSLINIAVDYYKDKDDVKSKFHAYYYLGRIYTNANKLTKATLAYMEAEQLVDELNDNYLAGLLYNQLGDIYEEYYDFPKALESYQFSTEYYHKANKPLHKLYGMLSQSAVYKSMGKDTDSFHLLYNTLMEAKETNNATVIGHCLADLIMLCLKMNKQEEAISFYNDLTNNYSIDQMSSPFYANLSLLMAKEKNWEKSRSYMDQAWKRASTQSDSIILYKVSAQTAHLNSSYLEAYSNLKKSITLQNNKVRESLQQPVLTAQKNFLNQELEHKEYKLHIEKIMRLVSILLVSIIAMTIVFLVWKRLRKDYSKKLRRLEIENGLQIEKIQKEALEREQSLQSIALLLEQELKEKDYLSVQNINKLKTELEATKQHITDSQKVQIEMSDYIKELCQQKQALKNELDFQTNMVRELKKENKACHVNDNLKTKLLKKYFMLMEDMMNLPTKKFKKDEDKQTYLAKLYQDAISNFNGDKNATTKLEKMVNECNNDIMKHLRAEITLPDETYYLLACYLLAGYSVNIIACATKETTNTIYKRREKIRSIIKDSNAIHKDLFLQL